MKPDFTDRIAKIIAEFRTRTYIDGIDAKAISEILQDELSEYHNDVLTYCNTTGYDTGYDAGYDAGYEDGYMFISDKAADRTYSEGYSEGYYEGYDDGYERRACRLGRVFHGF